MLRRSISDVLPRIGPLQGDVARLRRSISDVLAHIGPLQGDV